MRARSQKPLKLNYNFYFKKVSYVRVFVSKNEGHIVKRIRVHPLTTFPQREGGQKRRSHLVKRLLRARERGYKIGKNGPTSVMYGP